MDFVGLGKHTFTFSSSLFDVVSDILNSLNFMGYYNPTTSNESSWMNISQESSDVTINEYREDKIWGIVGLIIVFLPGIFSFGPLVLIGIYTREWKYTLKVLVLGVTFPIMLLLAQLVPIYS